MATIAHPNFSGRSTILRDGCSFHGCRRHLSGPLSVASGLLGCVGSYYGGGYSRFRSFLVRFLVLHRRNGSGGPRCSGGYFLIICHV
jgi:hypothetical protein